jgi:hypothetical protein
VFCYDTGNAVDKQELVQAMEMYQIEEVIGIEFPDED